MSAKCPLITEARLSSGFWDGACLHTLASSFVLFEHFTVLFNISKF